jgi:hypothetical protein
MAETSTALLLIADISGFTRFMRQESISLNHAKQIVVTLLKSLTDSAQPPLTVAELEGDAVFFYALCQEGETAAIAEKVKHQMRHFFEAFNREVERIDSVRTCACDACVQVSHLKLKQVAHLGEIAREEIGRFEKLFGLDVIIVHRMLKNTVDSKEYVMMSRPMYQASGGFFGLPAEQRREKFEGVGEIDTFVFYPEKGPGDAAPGPNGGRGRVSWRWSLSWNFLLEYMGIRKIPGIFRNFPGNSGRHLS